MHYRNILFIFFLSFLTSCTAVNVDINKLKLHTKDNYTNKGFTLIYDENLLAQKIISKKLDERSLIIFQRNLKKNTQVKITNLLNNKSLIANVGKNSEYPAFNNSVVSIRIANDLNLNIEEPYIEIIAIPENSLFIAKRAKTFDEEKKVADKAPVDTISINNLNEIKIKNNIKKQQRFSYVIKVADFYFNETAQMMMKKIISETSIKKPKIKKISDKKYRVYLGPFNNINSLQKSYNDINILVFENIEIIKND